MIFQYSNLLTRSSQEKQTYSYWPYKIVKNDTFTENFSGWCVFTKKIKREKRIYAKVRRKYEKHCGDNKFTVKAKGCLKKGILLLYK
jgi:hypothetical protein